MFTRYQGTLYNVMAKSAERLDDYTYRLTMYDYVTDCLGNALDAHDAVFCYTRALEKGNLGNWMNGLKEIRLIDDYTFELEFSTTASGTYEASVTNVFVFSRELYQSDPDEMANIAYGTGAYMAKDYVPGSGLLLVKNENYWQKDKSLQGPFAAQNIDEIEFKVIRESAQMSIALETGEIDMMGYFPQTELYLFEEGGSAKGFKVHSIPDTLTRVLLYNCHPDNVFSNQTLRQAVSYAIDCEAIVLGAYIGKGEVVKTYGSTAYPDHLDKWLTEDYYDYNPEKAKQLLLEAGFSPGDLTVKIMTNTNTLHIRMAEIIQGDLTAVGIKSEILSYESALYTSLYFEPDAYDIRIENRGSSDYVVTIFKNSFDHNMFNGKTTNSLVDERMQELLMVAVDSRTRNAETTDAFHQYLKESAAGIGLAHGLTNFVYIDTIESLMIDMRQRLVPGACVYTDAFVGG